MGNEIAKKYDMSQSHTGLGGNSSLWKIYPATTKATGEKVSIFVLQKDEMLKLVTSKTDREQILNMLRKDIRALKALSHPAVLKVVHVFEETKAALVFVTEPVRCSLADQLQLVRPVPNPDCAVIPSPSYFLTEPEKARGAAQVLDALQYCHQVANKIHCGIAPDTIFIATTGEWKLGGFGFCLDIPQGVFTVPSPYFLGQSARFAGGVKVEPWLRYTAPELTAGGGEDLVQASVKVDMFSFGCVLYEVYHDSTQAYIQLQDENPVAHAAFFTFPREALLTGEVKEDVARCIRNLLILNPTQRPDIFSAASTPSFHAAPVTVLRTLDKLTAMDASSQATFLATLGSFLPHFEFRIHRDTVLPAIFNAGDQNPRLWGYVLPVAFDIVSRMNVPDFQENVQPRLKNALKQTNLNQTGLLQVVTNVKVLQEKMEPAVFVDMAVPLICKALEATFPQAQEVLLKHLADISIVNAIPAKTRNEQLIAHICRLAAKGEAINLQTNALLALAKTYRLYDEKTLVEKIFPTLRFCTEKYTSAAVLMCALGCYDSISKTVTEDHIARFILPGIMPLLVATELSSKQFETVTVVLQTLLGKVFECRRADYGLTATPTILAGTSNAAPVFFDHIVPPPGPSTTGLAPVNRINSLPQPSPGTLKMESCGSASMVTGQRFGAAGPASSATKNSTTSSPGLLKMEQCRPAPGPSNQNLVNQARPKPYQDLPSETDYTPLQSVASVPAQVPQQAFLDFASEFNQLGTGPTVRTPQPSQPQDLASSLLDLNPPTNFSSVQIPQPYSQTAPQYQQDFLSLSSAPQQYPGSQGIISQQAWVPNNQSFNQGLYQNTGYPMDNSPWGSNLLQSNAYLPSPGNSMNLSNQMSMQPGSQQMQFAGSGAPTAALENQIRQNQQEIEMLRQQVIQGGPPVQTWPAGNMQSPVFLGNVQAKQDVSNAFSFLNIT